MLAGTAANVQPSIQVETRTVNRRLRRTFAILLARSNEVLPNMVQKLMRHSSIRS